jgi:two-component system, cell cycle sensor histidine kinase and response regulator CckA
MTGAMPATLLALSAFLALLVLAGWLRLRSRYRQELADRDASYKALLEINVRHYRDIAERDARYRNLLEQAGEGVVAEVEGRVVFANPAAMKMFGWSRDEDWAGRSFLDLAAPESRETLTAIFDSPAASPLPERPEIVGLKADGSCFQMEVTPARMTFQGKTATQAILRDITERRRAEQALRESEERYRLLFENNPQPMWVFDDETLVFLAVNDAACQHYGYTREEFLGMTIRDIRPAEDVPALLRNLETGVRDFRRTGVWRHLKKNGMPIEVEVASHALHFLGRSAHLVLATDVTERKRAEEALRQSEQKYRDIFDFATVGIYQSRHDGSLITVNAPLAEMLGYDSPEDLMQSNLDEIYADQEARRELIARYEPQGKGHRLEVRWKRKDGTPIWLELDARAVLNPDGTTRYFEGFVHDITDRRKSEEEKRRLQEQLVQSQKMEAVGQLAGGIAHDFNNLLTAITGYSELLLGELPPEDPRRSHAEEIRKAGERAASLTQQLLAFSRRQVLEPKVLDVNTVVSDIERMLRRLIGEHIELKTRKEADLWKVRADPGQIEQAILNLVINARDAMPRGGTLAIETANSNLDESFARSHPPTRPGPYVLVAVSDTGVGITDEVKARLFEPFFTTKERGKGTGLGLSTTYGIVKQSGGYVWCDTGVGRGTTFRVFLPRVNEPVTQPEVRPVQAPIHPGDETVLLVEDEPEVRSLVQRILKTQGYTVVTAANPDEALAVAREFKGTIQVMVTDIVMPGMSGLQLAERLLPTRPNMRVLFVSGYTHDAIGPNGVLEPGTAFLQKPFTPNALARKVREVLESAPRHLKDP